MSVLPADTEMKSAPHGAVDPPRRPALGLPASAAGRIGLVLALLLASGSVRAWQAGAIDSVMARGRISPFKLGDVPLTIGSWVGSEKELDPRIVQATGSTELVTRSYVDQMTGVTLDVIILYGPTSDIFIHEPKLCYPKAGFTSAGDEFDLPIPLPDGGKPIEFHSVAYEKGEPGRLDSQEIVYAWKYNGRWSGKSPQPKESERIPGMYKVQVARRYNPGEARKRDNPCVSFLEALVPDLDARMAGHPPTAAPSPAAAPKTASSPAPPPTNGAGSPA